MQIAHQKTRAPEILSSLRALSPQPQPQHQHQPGPSLTGLHGDFKKQAHTVQLTLYIYLLAPCVYMGLNPTGTKGDQPTGQGYTALAVSRVECNKVKLFLYKEFRVDLLIPGSRCLSESDWTRDHSYALLISLWVPESWEAVLWVFLVQQYVTFPLMKCQTDAILELTITRGHQCVWRLSRSLLVTGFKMLRRWNGTIMNISRLELLKNSRRRVVNCMSSREQFLKRLKELNETEKLRIESSGCTKLFRRQACIERLC